jgi:hypothetical protein
MLPGLKVIWDAGGRFRVVDLVGSSSVIGGFGAEAPVVIVKSAVLKALLKNEPLFGDRLSVEAGTVPELTGPTEGLDPAVEPSPLTAVT